MSQTSVRSVAKPPTGVVTVSISQGALRGRKGKTVSGGPIVSFQGIPYAKPPVGPLRFKPPQPADSWTGIRDALQEGSVCFQFDPIKNHFIGEENCLFLNVYTPKLPVQRSDKLRPVMVFIHGGGFAEGSGNAQVYGPDYLVDEGVVLVTMNYRLGALGFLSLENEDIIGNMGLKDQALALKWVQENIACFGGNPKEVTIFGPSAGSASVHLHVLSPMSKGLFHRAIAQSGTVLNRWAISRNPRDRALRLGEAMGCKTSDLKDLFKFLMEAEPRQMVEAWEPSRSKEEKRRMVRYIFIPCVEPEIKGQEAFIRNDPEVLLKEGKFNRVPLMFGIASHEGIVSLIDIFADLSLLAAADCDFERLVPQELLPTKKDLLVSRQLCEKIKGFYFGCKSISEETLSEYIDLVTDVFFAVGIIKTMNLHTTMAPNVPVYFFQFCFDGRLNYWKNIIVQGKNVGKGACHADELGYIFRTNNLDVKLSPKSPELLTVKRMTKLWANFARTGNPTPNTEEIIPVLWKPYTASSPCYLKIDSDLSLQGQFQKERMDFWEDLYTAVRKT